MDLRHMHTPVQVWSVGLQVTLYSTAMTGFLGMLSAPRSENAYVPLIAINCPDVSEFSNDPSDSYSTRR